MSATQTNLQAARGGLLRDEATAKEDSVDKMWSAYMEEATQYDTRVSDTWKDDANGVIVFTSLFSATVASFIIESYKKLSSDSGDHTVFLLGQISQQLTALSPNGTYIPPNPYPSYSPGLSIILVNSFWLLSLVLSITSALTAILMQQWAREYVQLPQSQSVPRERAHVRSYLFLGTLKYPMQRIMTAAHALLHLSVFLFFIGLVLFFFTIFKTVAIVVSTCVGLFGLMYFSLTVLPCLDHCCPYRTPGSSTLWYFWHISVSFLALCARWPLKRLHGIIVPYNTGEVTSSRQRILRDWWKFFDDAVETHRGLRKDGLRARIARLATEASVDVVPKALTWLLNAPALANKNKVQDFVASIPGDIIVQLVGAPIPSGKTFIQHLSALMRSCAPGSIELDEGTRRRRLDVCLNAVHHIARAYSGVPYGVSLPETLLEDVRTNFANIGIMRSLWADEDPAVRVTSRSICALLARQILRRRPLHESELVWLPDVLGQSPNTIYNALGNLRTVDNMNVDSFVYGVLSYPTGDLPAVQEASFVDTLAILMSAGSRAAIHSGASFEAGLSDLLRRAENDDHLREVADKLRSLSSSLQGQNGH